MPSCDSCGSEVSAAAERASRALDHVSPETAAVIETTYGLKAKDLHLCAECFLAGYHLMTPHEVARA